MLAPGRLATCCSLWQTRMSLMRIQGWNHLALALATALLIGCAAPRAGAQGTADSSAASGSWNPFGGWTGAGPSGRTKRKTLAAIQNLPGAKHLNFLPKPQRDEGVAREMLLTAEELFRKAQYSDAALYYDEAGAHWPDSPLEEDALFMIGECHFFADAYPKSFEAYERLLQKYKRSKHLEKAVTREFAIGSYWLQLDQADPSWFLSPNLIDKKIPRMDTWGQALKGFERVRLNDPTGPLADDSLVATASAHFVRGRYADADYFYTLLRREYPESEHQYTAHLLGIQAKLLRYQGSTYDGTPLEEAKELAEQIVRQFPDMPPADRQRMMETRVEIAAELAKRDFDQAVFYANKGLAGAARHYYGLVAKNYPQTPMALEAQQRLGELAGLPDKPEPKAEWFTDLFPSEQDKGFNLSPEQSSPVMQASAPGPEGGETGWR